MLSARFLSTLSLAFAAAGSAIAAPNPSPAPCECGEPPKGVPPAQWEGIWNDCADQHQNGLINIGVEACALAQVEALVGAIIPLNKRTGDHGKPPAGITPPQWEGVWVKCEDQVQNGLINLGVDACVVAQVEALVGLVVPVKHRHGRRTGEHSKPPAGLTPTQFEGIKADCGHQHQTGLINIGVDACIIAQVEALVGAILKKRTGDHDKPPAGVCTPTQYEGIKADCGNQVQNGLINIGVDACILAQVEALIGGILHLKARTNDGMNGKPPAGVTPAQWESAWADCGDQVQNGLINVGVDACVVGQIEALVAAVLPLEKRTGENGNPPAGVTPVQWESIWADCGDQVQNGLINVGLSACVMAQVQALVAAIL